MYMRDQDKDDMSWGPLELDFLLWLATLPCPPDRDQLCKFPKPRPPESEHSGCSALFVFRGCLFLSDPALQHAAGMLEIAIYLGPCVIAVSEESASLRRHRVGMAERGLRHIMPVSRLQAVLRMAGSETVHRCRDLWANRSFLMTRWEDCQRSAMSTSHTWYLRSGNIPPNV